MYKDVCMPAGPAMRDQYSGLRATRAGKCGLVLYQLRTKQCGRLAADHAACFIVRANLRVLGGSTGRSGRRTEQEHRITCIDAPPELAALDVLHPCGTSAHWRNQSQCCMGCTVFTTLCCEPTSAICTSGQQQ